MQFCKNECNENLLLLRKNNLSPGKIIENSDKILKSLTSSATLSEKFHTKYLYGNGFSSICLPNYNSKNFKNQHKVPLKSVWKGFSVVPKKAKLSSGFETEEVSIAVSHQAPDKEARSNSIAITKCAETESLEIMDNGNETEVAWIQDKTNNNSETKPKEPIENNDLIDKEDISSTKMKNKDIPLKKPETMEEFQQFANTLLANLIKTTQKQEEEDFKNSDEFWVSSESLWICNSCLFYSNSPKVPKKLLTLRRGNFGYVNNVGKKIVANKKKHNKSPLHRWCVKRYVPKTI